MKNTHVESAFTKNLAKSLAIVAIDYTVLPPVLALMDWVVGNNDGMDKSRNNVKMLLETLLFWMTRVPTSTYVKNRLLTPLVRVWYSSTTVNRTLGKPDTTDICTWILRDTA